MSKKIINRETGELMISDDFVVSKRIKPSDLLDFFGKERVTIRDMKTGYIHCNVRDVSIDNILFAFTFIFNIDKLDSITFVFDYSPDDNWDNWSEEKELRKEKKYNGWLIGQVGATRYFEWGDVWAGYDPKGGSSHLHLKYS